MFSENLKPPAYFSDKLPSPRRCMKENVKLINPFYTHSVKIHKI
jgi:hypothetical protein